MTKMFSGYALNQQVRIKAIDTVGRVRAIILNEMGTVCHISYWSGDGSRNTEFMHPDEIEPT